MSRLPSALRQAVRDRALGHCEYCHSQASITGHEFSIDMVCIRQNGARELLDERVAHPFPAGLELTWQYP